MTAPRLTLVKYKSIVLLFKMKSSQALHSITCMLREVKISKIT